MSVLHDDFIYEMPVVIGMKITPSDSLTQAYVDHIDNLFRKERATLENQYRALTFLRDSTVASAIHTTQGPDAKTELDDDQVRGSIVAYHHLTDQLRTQYDGISKSAKPTSKQEMEALTEAQVAWKQTVLGVSMNAASVIKYACQVNPEFRKNLESTQATVYKKGEESKGSWESKETNLYSCSTKDANDFAAAWRNKDSVEALKEETEDGSTAAESK